jgi:hypothetical protein
MAVPICDRLKAICIQKWTLQDTSPQMAMVEMRMDGVGGGIVLERMGGANSHFKPLEVS